ncbi:hypothetical protein QS257_16260 [Terrilactibacillus sp. S3-3]|nr:hypothetical protein QS257_16260 [Terrilactibacillus sp. S3-3]
MGKPTLHLIKNKKYEANGAPGKRGYQFIIGMVVGLIVLLLILLLITMFAFHLRGADSKKKNAVHFGTVLGMGYTKSSRLLVKDASGIVIVSYKDGRWKARSNTPNQAKKVFLPIDKGYMSLEESAQNKQQLIERTAAGKKNRSLFTS